MFDPAMPIASEKVETQTVSLLLDKVAQLSFQRGPLARVHRALENRFLHALAHILACFGNLA